MMRSATNIRGEGGGGVHGRDVDVRCPDISHAPRDSYCPKPLHRDACDYSKLVACPSLEELL